MFPQEIGIIKNEAINDSHMISELLDVSLLLIKLLPELEELLLLALADSVILGRLLTALESITAIAQVAMS